MKTEWDNIKYVYLKRKKANGFPKGREIGDKLEVLGVHYNKNYTYLIIRGNRSHHDKFKIHESFVEKGGEARNFKLLDLLTEDITYYSDSKRHLVCYPYSIENLHLMAEDLEINACWFHKDHYDIPKRRIAEIREKTINVSSKDIVRIIRGEDLAI